jgi:glycosyltransferase involved in cell wall biosynthesis
MKIGLYVPRKPPTDGGGHTFEHEILQAFLRRAEESRHEFVLFSPKPFQSASWPPNVKVAVVGEAVGARLRGAAVTLINRFLTDVLQLPSPLRGEGWLDKELHCHGIEMFWNLNAHTVTSAVPYITVVWDLQYRLQPFFPEVSVDGRWERWERRTGTVLRRASYIIAGTEAGRREIESFYQIPRERIRILPHPTPTFAAVPPLDADITALADRRLPERFLFYPAQFWPHKNHTTLLDAMRRVRDQGIDVDLVLSGSDQGNLAHVRTTAERLGLTDHVHFPGFVNRAELVELYRRAEALAYVSLFGPENLPPLEAFALGCPVIASRVPGAEEQMGAAALLYEPADAGALADAIRRVLTDPDERRRLIEAGKERATRFTPDDFVRGVFAIFDEFAPIRNCWSATKPWRPAYQLSKLFRR